VLATQDPVDGFRGQSVKCGDGKLEVVFAGILKLVMADTAETLHGIVEGPRGHLVRSAANLTNGMLT
jgi:hypothetical protein